MPDAPIDHDRLFKQLLTTFFFEFIDLFLPEVSAYLVPVQVEFLDKEVFTDISGVDRHEVDLLAKVKFRDRPAFFLIHGESQAAAREQFAKRMFRYFARLEEKFDLPIYPVALLSYDAPLRPEPDRFEVVFPDRKVLEFLVPRDPAQSPELAGFSPPAQSRGRRADGQDADGARRPAAGKTRDSADDRQLAA